MKLIVQIPALNEEESLFQTISEIPREIEGIDAVEVLVIDDGSTDGTVEVAAAAGADHILSMPANVGLARCFVAGIEEALSHSADIIVNTDADNQYCGADIPKLIRPILDREAQIVVGARPIAEIQNFSLVKKVFQIIGSWVVRRASGTNIPDAPSGFRAYSKSAAAQLCVLNPYTYTLETIIQAGRKRIPMTSVPIRVNPVSRPSRLFSSIGEYILRSTATILRISIIYAPLRFFFTLAALIALPGLIAIGRFLILFFSGSGTGNIQSLVLASALLAMATVFFAVGILADMIAANRYLLEEIRARDLLGNAKSPSEKRAGKKRINAASDGSGR